MADITKFPIEKIYPPMVRGREVWAQQDPPDAMVWAVCPYTRMHQEETRCNHCPAWETDPQYGDMRRGCYGIAAEVCRVVFAMQKRQDNS